MKIVIEVYIHKPNTVQLYIQTTFKRGPSVLERITMRNTDPDRSLESCEMTLYTVISYIVKMVMQ